MDRIDTDVPSRPIFKVATSGSNIPIFTEKASEFQAGVEALKKKARIYQLTQTELVNLAYDYSDGVVSEYKGLYLDDNPGSTWGDLLEQLTHQYSDYTCATDAARALIKIKQREGETLSELASRVLGLAKGLSGETRTKWAETPPVAWDQGVSGHSGYRWRDHPHERGWRRPLPDLKQPGCWECGQLGHIRRDFPRMGCTSGRRRLVGRIQGNVVGAPKRK